MVNRVTLVGNVGADPETRTTQGGTRIANFSLATSRRKLDSEGKVLRDKAGKPMQDVEWHRIVCFNGVAKSVEAIVIKGQKLYIEGRIHNTRWTDKDGVERYGYEIIADNVTFLTKGRERPSSAEEGQQAPADDGIDDDVPF